MALRLQRLQKPSSQLDSGLFRSSTPRHLLSGFARIFEDTPEASFQAAGSSCSQSPSPEDAKLVSDALFTASAEAEHVEIFISHSWRAGRWLKYLALSLYFNLDVAVKCACGTWLLMVVVLLGRGGGMTSLGGSSLALPCLVYLPMSIFFLVLLLGHEIMGSTPSLWLDKLCIHQSDPGLKAEQISALAVFVARSERMLILWDDTYFERLWCGVELAIRARYGGAQRVEVLPLWLAPWLLTSMLLDLCSVTVFEVLEHVFPNWSAAWLEDAIRIAQVVLGDDEEMQYFVGVFCIWFISCIVYLPTSIPCFFAFRMKLRSHQLLLDEMAAFDVKNAKCTLPSDREAIEEQVRELFNEDGVDQGSMMSDVDVGEVRLSGSAFRGPLERFNAYVRGRLRNVVLAETGDEVFVAWRQCLVAFLPMIFYSSVNVLGCDNGPCETSFKLQHFRSVSVYMATNAGAWILCIALAFPLTYPILLRMLKFVFFFGDGPLQHFLAILCCPLAFIYNYLCGGLIWASLCAWVVKFSVQKLLLWAVLLLVMSAQVLWLFGQRRQSQTSCRCMRRQAAYEAVAANDQLLPA